MESKDNFSLLDTMPLYWLINDKPAAMMLYKIISGKKCKDIMCTRFVERSHEKISYINYDLLVAWNNGTVHSLTIRLLQKLEDLENFIEYPFEELFEIEDEEDELCCYIPRTRLLVYFLLSGALPGGKTVCRVGFPTGEDDIEDYLPEMPTMIISTEGEGDGSEISRLARYLKCPKPGNPQFGAIGRVVERWIEEYSNAAERSNNE